MDSFVGDILMHYGTKRHSGRWPWGSGENPFQHSGDFLSRVQELKKQGMSETDIVKELNLDSTTQLRIAYTHAKNERRALEVDRVKSLKADGYNTSEIARIMGKGESSIRSLLNADAEKNMNQAENTAKILKEELESKGMIDVGIGVERSLGISRTKFEEALFILEADGYNIYNIGLQTQPGKQTITKVLATKDTAYADVYKNLDGIQSFTDYHSEDGGKTWNHREYPASIDSKRVGIRYGDQGGKDKDGVIEIRRGVQDLDLGNSHYAQVRILVDGTHFLKGMAMYADDLPDGVDIMFNTNKKTGTDKMDVLKEIKKDDPDNPFGAYIKAGGQSYYDDPNGKYTDPVTGKKQSLSAINKLREEGEWDTYSKNLSQQFLSKQPVKLIKQQLNLSHADKQAEFDEICSLTNPTIKRTLLKDFADECDSAAIHMKAAALPRQSTKVILPVNAMKDTEVYAPTYNTGDKVCLVRYPHAGTFEIPTLTVNNNNRTAKSILGNVKDAIGINAKVAEQLSGADFDGDTVVVLPINSKAKIQTQPVIKELRDFDPKTEYATDKEGRNKYGDKVRLMTKEQKGIEMGKISNLITDMTLKGATQEQLIRAVKHSMVVIDAVKHGLDYKRSEKENGIAELKSVYQKHTDADGKEHSGGASTLLSVRKQNVRVPERKGSPKIDPETGELHYKESGRTYVDKKGKTVQATTTVSLMSTVKDAHSLSSGTVQENLYADYANKMKAMANQARKEYLATGRLKYDSNAKITYQKEVSSLNAKLNIAAKNAPKERRALAITNSVVKAKKQANPDMDKDEIKKLRQNTLDEARASVGAKGKETKIEITDREWEAIQAGAISDNRLSEILRYSNKDTLKQRAMPRTTTKLSTAKQNKIKAMSNSGYTIREIAKILGVSPSTVNKYL